jgi:thymidylate kinase
VHATLESLFSRLQADEVVWSLVRLPRNTDFPPGDVDLLVRSNDLARFDQAARAAGFVPVPGWQGWPTLMYLFFDRAAGRFLTLDVTDRIAFGRHGQLPTGAAPGVLERRQVSGNVATPSPDDAFWLLLLHCLLDKGGVPTHYRERLESGAAVADVDGECARLVDAHSGAAAALAAPALRVMAAAGQWEALEAAAEPLQRSWTRTQPLRESAQVWARRLRRAAARPALLGRRRGVSIALLGTNGAGKSTLSEGIAATFPLPVARVYMGLWKNADNDPSPARQLLDAAARPFRAWKLFFLGRLLQARGSLVVFDRYVHDARRPPAPPLVAVKRVYFWFLSRAIGTPDLTVLLDLPGAVAFARKGEDDIDRTEIERREFLALADQISLTVVDATRSPEEVRGDVLALLWDVYRARWGGGEAIPRRFPADPCVPVPPPVSESIDVVA